MSRYNLEGFGHHLMWASLLFAVPVPSGASEITGGGELVDLVGL